MVSIDIFQQVAKDIFTTQPQETEVLFGVSCCNWSGVTETLPMACGKCKKEISKYLRLNRDGSHQEVVR